MTMTVREGVTAEDAAKWQQENPQGRGIITMSGKDDIPDGGQEVLKEMNRRRESNFFDSPTVVAVGGQAGDLGDNNIITLTSKPRDEWTPSVTGVYSFEEAIAHEVGHNSTRKLGAHAPGRQEEGLMDNRAGKIGPTKEDAEKIIEERTNQP